MKSLSQGNKIKSVTRGAQLVPIRIPTICLNNLEIYLVIYYPNDNGERHKFSFMTTYFWLFQIEKARFS